MPLAISQNSGGVGSSLDAGSVTSGAINQVVCDSGALNAGNQEAVSYKINVNSYQSGTVDGQNSNLLVNIGGTNTAGIVTLGQTIGKLQSGPVFSQQTIRISITQGQHIYVCIGNSAPGVASTYNASISITRMPDKYQVP